MEGVIRHVLDWLIIVWGSMELGTVVSAIEGEATYDVWVSGHVDLDEPCWSRDSMFVGDGEGDEIGPDVVDESLWRVEG